MAPFFAKSRFILEDRLVPRISSVEEIMNRRLLVLAASAIAGICFAAHSAAQNPPSAAAPVTPVSTITKVDPGATPLPSTNELLQKFETVSGGRSVWSGFTTRYMKGIYQTEDASGFAADAPRRKGKCVYAPAYATQKQCSS
jgi:hypothetical protein